MGLSIWHTRLQACQLKGVYWTKQDIVTVDILDIFIINLILLKKVHAKWQFSVQNKSDDCHNINMILLAISYV